MWDQNAGSGHCDGLPHSHADVGALVRPRKVRSYTTSSHRFRSYLRLSNFRRSSEFRRLSCLSETVAPVYQS
jgi:hypothetical protein